MRDRCLKLRVEFSTGTLSMSARCSSPTREMRVSGTANGAQMRRREKDEARRWGEGEAGRKRVEEGYMSQGDKRGGERMNSPQGLEKSGKKTPPPPPPTHTGCGETGDLQSHCLALCLFIGTRFQSWWSSQVTHFNGCL